MAEKVSKCDDTDSASDILLVGQLQGTEECDTTPSGGVLALLVESSVNF